METKVHSRTLSDIAAIVGGEMHGDGATPVDRLVPAGSDDPRGLAFAESDAYLARCLASRVGSVIAKRGSRTDGKPAILVEAPRAAFFLALAEFSRPLALPAGVHPTAVVSARADVHPSARIGAYCVIEDGVKIGQDCRVFPFCYVGEGCQVGDQCVLFPHAVLYQDVVLGQGCIVHAGAVVGADGFGFYWNGNEQAKIPQVGGVMLGSDVEVGANSTIDRATCGETRVGDGVKIDNSVQVGHNVVIGAHTVLASHTCIGGSSEIGSRVMFGGNAAVADHVRVADGAAFGGCSGVFQDVEEPGQYLGLPPVPIKTAMRQMALQKRLPELFQRLKALESEVERLRNG